MLKDQKILITGITSPLAQLLAASLTGHNEVWGTARFHEAGPRAQVEAMGIRTAALDIGAGDFAGLPADFTHVLHLAYYRSNDADFGEVYRVNAEGTGLLLSHCRKAKSILYMSSHVVYAPHEDPFYAQRETDPLGTPNAGYSATSAVSKLTGEAVARYCAREFAIPVTVARLNAPYANRDRLLPTMHMDAVMADKEIITRFDPQPYSPIHTDDMCDQVEALLDAASVPATIVNWAGDEVVTAQQWCQQAAELGGKRARLKAQPVEGSQRGLVSDVTKRKSITGPCKVAFTDGFRRVYEARHGGSHSGG